MDDSFTTQKFSPYSGTTRTKTPSHARTAVTRFRLIDTSSFVVVVNAERLSLSLETKVSLSVISFFGFPRMLQCWDGHRNKLSNKCKQVQVSLITDKRNTATVSTPHDNLFDSSISSLPRTTTSYVRLCWTSTIFASWPIEQLCILSQKRLQ